MAKVFTVSNSKLSLWRRCHYAAHLRYVEKLQKRVKSRPLRFGSLAHDMLEADANGDDPMKKLKELSALEHKKLFASERDELKETADEVRWVMTDYFDYWENQGPASQQFTYLRRKGRAAEHEFTLPLVDGINLTGKLDGLASGDKRQKLLVETKTFRSMAGDDHRWRNLQTNLYKWATDKLGVQVDRLVWNYIRSKPPTVPKVKKDGSISLKRLDTLPSALRDFAERQDIKLPSLMLKTAQNNRKNYFIRIFSAPRPKTVKFLMADVVETAIDMSEGLGKKKAKTIDRHCEWCEFEAICRAELTGSDRDFVIKREYERREREEPEIEQV
jgi:CRISPR/Cas system-associated exonuclease Cas4 (RecB family)